MATRTRTDVYIPNAADQRTLLIAPHIDTNIAMAPFVGVKLRLWRQWMLTTTLHVGTSWDTSGENRVRFWDYTYPTGETAVVQAYSLTQGAEPLRVGLGTGTSGTLGETQWRLGLQAGWARWSAYRDRHGERPESAWHDTVNVGVGWALERGGHELTGELGVAPTPVPEQTGRTNYVDNTRWGLSVGGSVPLSFFATDYALGLYLQGQVMLPRVTEKRADARAPVRDELPDGAVDRVRGEPLTGAAGLQTNNPGFPGYTSFGTLLGASLVLKVRR
jgi:hypothetical protein